MLINRSEREGGIVHVSIIGRLEWSGRTEFLEACKTAENQKLLIDLTFASYISLEGVQALANVAIDKGIPKTNVFLVTPLEETVKEKIDAVGISQHLTFFPGTEIALETLRAS